VSQNSSLCVKYNTSLSVNAAVRYHDTALINGSAKTFITPQLLISMEVWTSDITTEESQLKASPALKVSMGAGMPS
jgi:hypothetical protein